MEHPRVHVVTVRDGEIVRQSLWEVTQPDNTLLLVAADGKVDVRFREGVTPPELGELN